MACKYCAHTETVPLIRDTLNGIIAEADYFCASCHRHLYFFAYGAVQEGSGQMMSEEDKKKVFLESNLNYTDIAIAAFLCNGL